MNDVRVPAVAGLLLVDKPAGMTSHDVVARVRRLAGTRRVGHAGTLDPMATGVLILGIGSATRLLTYLVGADKDYDATIRLGVATTTDDAEGEITGVTSAAHVTDAQIVEGMRALTGHIEQRPSTVSAIKVDGKRAYARVRAGEQVDLATRPVQVAQFEMRTRSRHDEVIDLDVHVRVSSGTYVRALARDLGAGLGVGGHLTSLRRTRVGSVTLAMCHALSALEGLSASRLPILPLADALAAVMPVVHLPGPLAVRARHGARLSVTDLGQPVPSGPVGLLDPDGVAIAVAQHLDSVLAPEVVFA